jgi:hypothetical protein
MRITKAIAEETAKKMVASKQEALGVKVKELSTFTQNYLFEKVPNDVKECFKSNPKFIKTDQSFRFTGLGFNHEWISTLMEIPSTTQYIGLDQEDSFFAEKAIKMSNAIDKQKDRIKNLKAHIESALLSFGTVKKASEMFSECAEFLPKDEKFMPPSVNLGKIRELLTN